MTRKLSRKIQERSIQRTANSTQSTLLLLTGARTYGAPPIQDRPTISARASQIPVKLGNANCKPCGGSPRIRDRHRHAVPLSVKDEFLIQKALVGRIRSTWNRLTVVEVQASVGERQLRNYRAEFGRRTSKEFTSGSSRRQSPRRIR
jgi:hypothetical protein